VISFLFRFNVCTYCNNIILVFVSSKLIQIHRSGFLVIKAALVRKQHARTPTSPTHCRCDVSIFSRLIFEWVIHKTKTETCFWPRVDLMSHAAAYIMCCVSVKLHLTNRRTQDKSVVFVHRWSFQGTLGNVILIYQNVSIKVGIWWRNCNLWPVYDNFQQLCGAKVEWGGTDPVRISGNIFWSCPSTFLALKVGLQLVVLVSAFVMASTVRSVSCLLFFSSRCPPPHAQPFVKVGARAPVPHGSRRHWFRLVQSVMSKRQTKCRWYNSAGAQPRRHVEISYRQIRGWSSPPKHKTCPSVRWMEFDS